MKKAVVRNPVMRMKGSVREKEACEVCLDV